MKNVYVTFHTYKINIKYCEHCITCITSVISQLIFKFLAIFCPFSDDVKSSYRE